MVQWDDIRLLLAVARQGSYAKAARETGLSLATVSRRLSALERSLGTVLVERRPDGHRLTPRAHALLPAASRMEAAAGDLRANADTGYAEVRVAAREWEALFLIRHIRALRASLPNIQIEVGFSHWPDLTRREADLVLTEHSPTANDVVIRKLGRMAFAVYAGQLYAAAEPRAASAERFRGCDWVGLTPAHRYFATEQWMARNLPDGARPVYRFDNAFMILEAVRGGAGLGLLPVWLAEHDAALPRVSEVLPDLDHQTNLLVNADLRHEPRVRAVSDAIGALFRRERGALLAEAAG